MWTCEPCGRLVWYSCLMVRMTNHGLWMLGRSIWPLGFMYFFSSTDSRAIFKESTSVANQQHCESRVKLTSVPAGKHK